MSDSGDGTSTNSLQNSIGFSETQEKEASNQNAIVVLGEAPESDDEYEDVLQDVPETSTEALETSEETLEHENIVLEAKYNTLLHIKLREKNENFRRQIIDLSIQPYASATRQISGITKNLMQSQKMIQGISTCLRKVSKELFQLEDNIDNIRNDKNLFINFVETHKQDQVAT